jgi:hypothetical protein
MKPRDDACEDGQVCNVGSVCVEVDPGAVVDCPDGAVCGQGGVCLADGE